MPALADWAQVDATRWRFRLRPGRRPFHDGTPLVAADVVATYRTILDPAFGSPQRAGLAHLREAVALDDDTVDFVLDRPDPLFPGLLTSGIVPARAAGGDAALARTAVGSGPLRLVGWPEDGRVLLQRADDGLRVQVLVVPDATVRALKLARGEVDLLAGDLPPETARWLAGRPGLVVERAPGATFAYLGFRLDDPVVGRREVREAIAHAIDREGIVRHLFGGAARPAATILPPEHWAGAPGLAPPAYDPQRARQLLAAAGYGAGRRPRLVYSTSGNPFRVRVAAVIRQQLQDVGFDVELRPADWATFFGDVREGRFQMFGLSWVALRMPDVFRYAFHSQSLPPAGANRGGYASPRVDALIEAAEAEPELSARAPRYAAIARALVDDLPVVPLWYEDQVLARSTAVRGYALDGDGSYDGLAGASLGR